LSILGNDPNVWFGGTTSWAPRVILMTYDILGTPFILRDS
jgi:hypothetical protein